MKLLFFILIEVSLVWVFMIVQLAISDAGWLAIPIIIGSLFTGVIGIITLFMNAKLNKNNKETEEIKKTVGVVAEKVEVVHKTINSGLQIQLDKEKLIGKFEGAEAERTKNEEKEKDKILNTPPPPPPPDKS